MNLKRIVLSNLFLFQMLNIFCQSIDYSYDATGMRTNRVLTVQPLQLKGNDSLLLNPKNLNLAENALASSGSTLSSNESPQNRRVENVAEKRIGSEDIAIVMVVYPNPNKGLIKIDISNMPINSKNEMRLYDLSGNEIKVKRNFESQSEIDISQFKDGIYILRVKINDTIFDWKVVKSSY